MKNHVVIVLLFPTSTTKGDLKTTPQYKVRFAVVSIYKCAYGQKRNSLHDLSMQGTKEETKPKNDNKNSNKALHLKQVKAHPK